MEAIGAFQEKMQIRPLNVPVSLYLHIPFCRAKCDYCDFFSVDSAGDDIKRRTVEQIKEDTRTFLELLDPPGIETIYVGGGTPNSLDAELFEDLMKMLRRTADSFEIAPSEWTVELNPELLTGEQLKVMEESGVTRLSIGVQSFRDDKLSLIGRKASAEDARRALDLISNSWRGDWSLDIISLLPEETEKFDLVPDNTDIEEALRYRPDHISLYGLSPEPGTPLFEKIRAGCLKLPEEGVGAEILKKQWDFLEKSGFIHYEVSNFASREEKKSRHNLRYWRLEPYLGIGPGAVSTLRGAEGPVRIRFLPDISLYTSPDTERAAERSEVELISPFSFLLEHLMTGIRTDEGVQFSRIAKRFGKQTARMLFQTLGPKLSRYEQNGLIERIGDKRRRWTLRKNGPWRGFRAGDSGLMVLDYLLLDLSGDIERGPSEISGRPWG